MSPFTLAQVTSLTPPFRAGFAHFSQSKMTGFWLMDSSEAGYFGVFFPNCWESFSTESETSYFSDLTLPFMHSIFQINSIFASMHFLFVSWTNWFMNNYQPCLQSCLPSAHRWLLMASTFLVGWSQEPPQPITMLHWSLMWEWQWLILTWDSGEL